MDDEKAELIETLSTGYSEADKEGAVMAERLRCANLITGWQGKIPANTRAELTRRILDPEWDAPPVSPAPDGPRVG